LEVFEFEEDSAEERVRIMIRRFEIVYKLLTILLLWKGRRTRSGVWRPKVSADETWSREPDEGDSAKEVREGDQLPQLKCKIWKVYIV